VYAETSQLILEIVYEHFNSDLSNAYFFASNNIAMRRSDYLASGGFDGEFGSPASEDREFCDRWRLQGRSLRWVPSAQVEHRHHRRSGHSPACTTGTAAVRFSTRTVVVIATQAPWSRTWVFTAPFPGV
jgi:GT2 family glycosyltransferase